MDRRKTFNLLQSSSNIAGYKLTNVTKNFLQTGPNPLSRHMDGGRIVRGPYHRVMHGHDPLMNSTKVYKRFGIKGLRQYPHELAKDFVTPNGLPMPGVEKLVKERIVPPRFATHWLSLNLVDVLTGGFAWYGTYRLYKDLKTSKDKPHSALFTIGMAATKIAGGVVSHNPILLASGLTDGFLIFTNFEDLERLKIGIAELLKEYAVPVAIGFGAGLAVGTAASAATSASVAALATASTGTAISTLTGAAATNATLAAIGGGSLASGGLGILGGTIILTGGSALIGIGAGFAAIRAYKNWKS